MSILRLQKMVSLPLVWWITPSKIVKCQNIEFREEQPWPSNSEKTDTNWWWTYDLYTSSLLKSNTNSLKNRPDNFPDLTTKDEYSVNPIRTINPVGNCSNKNGVKSLLTLGLLSFSFLCLCGGRSALVLARDCWKKPWETGSGGGSKEMKRRGRVSQL